ncbi:hypothetical protein LCM4573_26215 [Rhizobium sp. LCM 4573]|nr:hypothetical protein LCM4573_26215 [Rhizobium sp. LCM 4573]
MALAFIMLKTDSAYKGRLEIADVLAKRYVFIPVALTDPFAFAREFFIRRLFAVLVVGGARIHLMLGQLITVRFSALTTGVCTLLQTGCNLGLSMGDPNSVRF